MNKPFRVLVVDDFKAFREWIRLKLKTHGHFLVVDEAANAREAIQKARQLTPDLILLDISLPDMNGLDAHQELHRAVPSARVLFLSGCDDRAIVRRALSNGVEGYLLKADANRELVPAMRAVVAGKRFVSSRLRTTTDADAAAQPLIYQLADAT